MLVARKCRALMDAVKASCVSFFPSPSLPLLPQLNFPPTKNRLEERGWKGARSSHGGAGAGNNGGSVLMLKTKKKQIDRERYLDVTQRGIVRALNASTFGAPVPGAGAGAGSGSAAAPVAVAAAAVVVPARVSSSSSSERGAAGSVVGGSSAADSGSDTASVTDVPRHRRLRHMLKRF
ncbi:hypothetical protein BC826DRAFT_657172 [Russula brevipes]|nr:hypothetical protein BC826DRAFT_657172 [Russula brevipes]